MKRTTLYLLAYFVAGIFFTQAQIQDSGNHGLMTLTTKKQNLNEVQGSPYLDKNYKSGIVLIEDKNPLVVFMRYDALNENVEIKTDFNSEEVFFLPPNKKTKYKIGNQKFVYDQLNNEGNKISGYFIEHFNGNNFRLLEKPSVTVTEPVTAKTGYEKDKPAQIKIENEYYIQKENGNIEKVRLRHKDIKKTFNSKTAEEYLSNNRIKSVDDLISFVQHLDKQ